MKDKLIIIGGSGSLQDDKNKIKYEKIYPGLIEKSKKVQLCNLSKPGNDVSEAIKDLSKQIHKIEPQVALIDLGLVDCSPRVFSRRELSFLLSLPESVQRITYGIQKKHRRLATKIRNKVYVSIDLFEKNYREIINECKEFCDMICAVSITRPTDYVCNKSFGMLDNIIAYNKIIRELSNEYGCKIIDVFEATSIDISLLAHDGYHLSEQGHFFIFNEFRKHLEAYDKKGQ